MQTHFSLAALADSDTAQAEKILRACVHCGFCTATCPTYLLTGDELDSPRGRIYLIKDMLEHERPADARVARHLDRCLSCLSCMTHCPSGVHYMHLVDHARAHVEETYSRPVRERLLRNLLAFVLTRPGLLRLALRAVALVKPVVAPFERLMPASFAAMLALAPQSPAGAPLAPQIAPAKGVRKLRVALLAGCAQQAINPDIHAATLRLLTRFGVEVVVADGAGCCGALPHHLGKADESHEFARRNILAWTQEKDARGLDYVVVNTSGCGTSVKDYGFMFRDDAALAQKAAQISAMARDVSEILGEIGYAGQSATPSLRVAYHSACSLQHGQKIVREPVDLLTQAGFDVQLPPESHICCGSAGVYNVLQLELAGALRARKVENIESLSPQLIAAGNIGCMTQIGAGTRLPVVHTVELLDWASGGPRPSALRSFF